jgi:NitT/TauT family transport system substrate-binding protein
MDQAFRDGKGRYVQQQGPFPQQLEADGVGHIVATCGPKIGPVAFSSLAARRDWLQSDVAKAFMRAYAKTRAYMLATPAIEIAKAEKSFFPTIGLDVLAQCIAGYQQLGCWTPHVEITRPAFEVALDVFEHFGSLKQRYAYDQVCAPPPSEG